jgi:hypothetical protein
MRARLASLAACAAMAAAAGCGDNRTAAVPDDAPVDAPFVFIAFSSSFQPFRSWRSVHDPGPPAGSFPPDVLGPRTQYINQPPPHGATEFPIGTIIVEARENGTMNIFAGVKRGAGFNPTGAKNWEWFELSEDSGSGQVLIQWRGYGPPNNAMYGGDPNGSCNTCHIACGASNDYVCSPELQLTSF